MDKYFKQYDIPYFLMGGSLIGAVRNNPPGPMKWDDDADVGLLDEKDNLGKLEKLLNDPEFNKEVYFSPIFWGYQFIHMDYYNNHKEIPKWIVYDLFIMEPQTSGEFKFHFMDRENGHNKAQKWWPDAGLKWYPELVDCDFMGFTVSCFKRSVEYLMQAYGANVFTHAVIWSHDDDSKLKVKVDDYPFVNEGYLASDYAINKYGSGKSSAVKSNAFLFEFYKLQNLYTEWNDKTCSTFASILRYFTFRSNQNSCIQIWAKIKEAKKELYKKRLTTMTWKQKFAYIFGLHHFGVDTKRTTKVK